VPSVLDTPRTSEPQPVDALLNAEEQLILVERAAARRQPFLFDALENVEAADDRIREAARLFLSRRARLPYYWSFEKLAELASGNVEQFLAVTGHVVERMIFRAELGRQPVLTAPEQEELVKEAAEQYYSELPTRYARGVSIKQLVDNLGAFFEAATYRPTAPIAPGVNGFGLTREELVAALSLRGSSADIRFARDVLTSAVAGNVVSVRETKQGDAGAQKIVFYFNRLLCVKFNLPLNYGGWQPLPIKTVIEMMRRPVPSREWNKRWSASGFDAGAL
jgi:hypothetical protein